MWYYGIWMNKYFQFSTINNYRGKTQINLRYVCMLMPFSFKQTKQPEFTLSSLICCILQTFIHFCWYLLYHSNGYTPWFFEAQKCTCLLVPRSLLFYCENFSSVSLFGTVTFLINRNEKILSWIIVVCHHAIIQLISTAYGKSLSLRKHILPSHVSQLGVIYQPNNYWFHFVSCIIKKIID